MSIEAYILYVIIQSSAFKPLIIETSQMEFASKETCEYAMKVLIEDQAKHYYKFDTFCFKK